MNQYDPDYSRACQAFHNFVDMMAKAEMYPKMAGMMTDLLQIIEDECVSEILALEKDKESFDLECQWLHVIESLSRFMAMSSEQNHQQRTLRIVRKEKTDG